MGDYVSIDHLGIVNLRVDFPDIYSDFPIMAAKAFEHWGDCMSRDDRDGITYITDQCVSRQLPFLQHNTRIYVTTEYAHPHLVMVDTRQDVIDHMLSVFADDPIARNRWREYLDCIVVWVFQGDGLVSHTPINPGALAQLVTAFHHENLIARDHIRLNWNMRL